MQWRYMKLSMLCDRTPDYEVNPLIVRAIITKALLDLYGEVGAAIPVDVLKCISDTPAQYSIMLRVADEDTVKLWSSLTLLGSYNGVCLAIRVIRESTCLASLALSSTEFNFSKGVTNISDQ